MTATDDDNRRAADLLDDLALESQRIKNLERAIRRRQLLIHDLAALKKSNGERLVSNYAIAKRAGMSPQSVGETLSKPRPPEEN